MTEGKGHSAVRAMKRPRLSDGQVWQELELFPTPPWATRTLFRDVLPALGVMGVKSAWEPCAGLGHMSEVMRENVCEVIATDVHDYGAGGVSGGFDFLETVARPPAASGFPEWVITNPPFGKAADMAECALAHARVGVAFLLRLQFLETIKRYRFFKGHRPVMATFTERVPMCEGGYDPKLSTATAYAWFVWLKGHRSPLAWNTDRVFIDTLLIPPGRKRAHFNVDVDLKLAARCVPGFVPPSTLKKTSKAQLRLEDA